MHRCSPFSPSSLYNRFSWENPALYSIFIFYRTQSDRIDYLKTLTTERTRLLPKAELISSHRLGSLNPYHTFPKNTLSYHIDGAYLKLIHYRSLQLTTLQKYTLSYYTAEVYYIFIHC